MESYRFKRVPSYDSYDSDELLFQFFALKLPTARFGQGRGIKLRLAVEEAVGNGSMSNRSPLGARMLLGAPPLVSFKT